MDTTINLAALGDVESGAGERDSLAQMKGVFAGIASAPAVFGDVPNGAQAAAALEQSARGMLDQLEAAGQSVADIQASAKAAAGIGEDTDVAAQQTLSSVQVHNVEQFNADLDNQLAGTFGVGW
ncbi:hypothetical protein [Streptomyces sp. B6B3]|uniref:hypothetical protein n=1 Tax=Streptomyces sp. B6B3 TaxID=3153570 RepID=UPI00325F9321